MVRTLIHKSLLDLTPVPSLPVEPSYYRRVMSVPGLVGYWPLDAMPPNSGDPYLDLVGQMYPVPVNGTPSTTSGPIAGGDGISLSSTVHLDLGAVSKLTVDPTKQAFTIAGWFNENTGAPTRMFARRDTGLNPDTMYAIYHNQVSGASHRIRCTVGGTVDGNNGPTFTSTDGWHFAILRNRVVSGAGVSNVGVASPGGTVSWGPDVIPSGAGRPASSVRLGAWDAAGGGAISLAHWAFWDRAITDSEVQRLIYNSDL